MNKDTPTNTLSIQGNIDTSKADEKTNNVLNNTHKYIVEDPSADEKTISVLADTNKLIVENPSADEQTIIDLANAHKYIVENPNINNGAIYDSQDWNKLGQGGYGMVYKVYSPLLNDHVAIKVADTGRYKDSPDKIPLLIGALVREMQVGWRINHSNLVTGREFYKGNNGFGILMELIQGESLKEWMGRLKHTSSTPAQRPYGTELLKMLDKLAEVLEVIHGHGVVHQDIKPANIILRNRILDDPVLVDLGVAAAYDKLHKLFSIGKPGGTLNYMSPEQYEKRRHNISGKSDIFALGVMAWEMFTGVNPINKYVISNSNRDRNSNRDERLPLPTPFPPGELPSPSQVDPRLPRAFDVLLMNMLNADPDMRPSAVETRKILNGIQVKDLCMQSRHSRFETVPFRGGRVKLRSILTGGRRTEETELDLPGFCISATTVTRDQFRACFDSLPESLRNEIKEDNPNLGYDFSINPNHPVTNISWATARKFAQRQGGDLPTWAQWWCAAVINPDTGQIDPDPWGRGPIAPKDRANLLQGIGYGVMLNVNSHPGFCNHLGLHHMCGNVWEWCLDMGSEQSRQHRLHHERSGRTVRTPDPQKKDIAGCSYKASCPLLRPHANEASCPCSTTIDASSGSIDVGFRIVWAI